MRKFGTMDERLNTVFDMLSGCTSVADVGCDHGYLSAALVKAGAERVVASDISEASVDKARELAARLGIEGRMNVIRADGLDAAGSLTPPFGIAVCGMGGELIAKILSRGESTAKRAERIVMQPMRGEAELRRFLYGNGYRIYDERIVLDEDRYYQIIAAKPNEDDVIPEGFPKDWFRFGWVMASRKEPLLMPLLTHYRAVYVRELERARAKGSEPKELTEEIARTEELMRFVGVNEGTI